MKTVFYSIATVFLCCTAFPVFAQIAGVKVFSLPTAYEWPSEQQGILQNSQDKYTTHLWAVYSDRDDNPSYSKAEIGSPISKTVKFMEEFFVIDEQNDMLHVVKWDRNSIESSKKHKTEYQLKEGFEANDYGWMPKTKLLLWSNSFVNASQFSIKALPVLKNPEAFKNPEKYIDPKSGGRVYIYNAPDNSAKPNDNSVKMFQFLYVYKYENNKALVGKSPTILSNPENCILGWIDTTITQVWHHSICLWPNQEDDKAISERQQNNVKASLFLSKQDAKAWGDNQNPQPVWNNDPYDGKILADVKRMPIIDIDPNTGVYTTGTVTDVLEKNGATLQNVNQKAETDSRYAKIREHIRTVNVVFVVDGSSKFQTYFATIQKAIHDIASNPDRSTSDYKNHLFYSAVVYRNVNDNKCSVGDQSANTMTGFSKNWSDVNSFLDAQFAIHGCSGDDPGPHALYSGLKKGLRMFADQDDEQTNMIILIGGEGDVTDIAKQETDLSHLIAQYKVGIIGCQLQNGVTSNFTDFITQFDRIITKGVSGLANDIKKANPEKAKKFNGNNWCIWHDVDMGGKQGTKEFFDYPELSPLPGALIYPPISSSMATSDLELAINKVIDTTDKVIERNIEKFSAQITGVGNNKDEVKLNPALLMYFDALGEKGGTTSTDVINKYMDGGYQFFITGYTVPKVNKLSNAVFSHIIFASSDEYDHLSEKFRGMSIQIASPKELRDALCDAMFQIVASYVGDARANEVIKNMNPDQLQALITGLHSNNQLLSQHSIKDYADEKKVPNEQVSALAEHFQNIDEKLRRIRQDPHYTFKNEDAYYYWLPDNLLN